MTIFLRKGGAAAPAWLDGSAWPVLLGLAFASLATNLILPATAAGGWSLYAAQPLIWGGIGLYCLRQRDGRPASLSRGAAGLALLTGAFHVAAFAIAGLVYGFGQSPYAHAPVALIANLFYLGSVLFGVEMARSFLLARLADRPVLGFLAVALLLAAISLPLGQLTALTSGEPASIVVGGERALPATTSLLATLLALIGGPWAALIYRAVLLAVEWSSPLLPDLNWLTFAIVGTLAPGLVFAIVQGGAAAAEPAEERGRASRGGWPIAVALALTAAVWLNTGLLGLRPAIVSGISMEPSLQLGDIVETKTVDAATLVPVDVIRFQTDGVPILHRVLEVRRDETGLSFVTQGDSNDFVDAPMPAAAVEGKVVLTIPKLGLLPITVKRWLARQIDMRLRPLTLSIFIFATLVFSLALLEPAYGLFGRVYEISGAVETADTTPTATRRPCAT